MAEGPDRRMESSKNNLLSRERVCDQTYRT